MEFEKIQKIIAAVLSVDPGELTPETRFVDDLCADSLDVYQMVLEVEDTFGVSLLQEQVEKLVTVQDVLDLLGQLKAQNA